jgi:tetratricopeptide (TPR) repeat protein
MADLMLHLDRLESAEKEYLQVIQIYRSVANFHEMDLANALRGYALLLEKKNKSKEAVIAWKEARGLYDKYKIAEGVQEADQHFSETIRTVSINRDPYLDSAEKPLI